MHACRSTLEDPTNFPWVAVAIGFLLALAIGLALMILEADRPLRRLQADSVALGAGKHERLPEDHHGGRFGSIARSVNIKVDKQGRELKNARRNLEQLLGPGGEDALDDAPAPAPQAPSRPPPPSEFKFSSPSPSASMSAASSSSFGSGGGAPLELAVQPRSTPMATPTPAQLPPPVSTSSSSSSMQGRGAARGPIAMPATPRAAEPTPAPTPPPSALDDDILSMPTASLAIPASGPSMPGTTMPIAPTTLEDEADEETYFRSIFNEFVAMKKHCGEPIAGLTYARFADKLRRNRDDLMAKPGCIDVRFSVYVKDGKAALKATPVKET